MNNSQLNYISQKHWSQPKLNEIATYETKGGIGLNYENESGVLNS